MSGIPANQTAIAYATDLDLHVRVSGSWDGGGVVELFCDGERIEHITLPPVGWTVVALLVRAAKLSIETTWTAAFRTATKLAEGLKEHDVSYRDATGVHRIILELRKQFSKLQSEHPLAIKLRSEPGFGKRLLASYGQRGYRFNIPPENLQLFIIDGDDVERFD